MATISGTSGDDTLDGTIHDDTIDGRGGDDVLRGGAGNDTLIDGTQGFAFIGNASFNHVAGELRYEVINGNTYAYGDTNGDGTSDFIIGLDGSHVLASADFVI